MSNNIDQKVYKLLAITDTFIFPEYYSHTEQDMWKIFNPFTKYAHEKLVLCPLSEGMEAALDLAIEVMAEKRASAEKQ
jgi:hypothetical protein